jgi:hypothetical protein
MCSTEKIRLDRLVVQSCVSLVKQKFSDDLNMSLVCREMADTIRYFHLNMTTRMQLKGDGPTTTSFLNLRVSPHKTNYSRSIENDPFSFIVSVSGFWCLSNEVQGNLLHADKS